VYLIRDRLKKTRGKEKKNTKEEKRKIYRWKNNFGPELSSRGTNYDKHQRGSYQRYIVGQDIEGWEGVQEQTIFGVSLWKKNEGSTSLISTC